MSDPSLSAKKSFKKSISSTKRPLLIPALHENDIQKIDQIQKWYEMAIASSSNIHEVIRAVLTAGNYDPMEALKYSEPTAIPDPRIQFAMDQSVMTQYIAELQAYHIQWQMQPKFSIDHTQIATIANMKKDELTEYISDNSIDPTRSLWISNLSNNCGRNSSSCY
jgi:hypothetical protein